MPARKRRSDREANREAAARLLQESGQDLFEVADKPEYQQFPPGFNHLCRKYAKHEYWTLHQAVCLLCGVNTERPRDVLPGHEFIDKLIDNLENRLVSSGLWLDSKRTDEMVRATDVMGWIRKEKILIPATLAKSLGYDVGSSTTNWTTLGGSGKSRDPERAAARTRVRDFVAEYWENHPDMRPGEIVELEEVKNLAPHYQSSLREWIKDLHPTEATKKGGRPRKKSE